jgi:hypothetical protein
VSDKSVTPEITKNTRKDKKRLQPIRPKPKINNLTKKFDISQRARTSKEEFRSRQRKFQSTHRHLFRKLSLKRDGIGT